MWVSGKDWGEEKEKLAEQLRTIFHMVRVMMHKTYATISLLNSHQYYMNGEHPKLPQYCPNISSSATVEFKCSNILTTTLLLLQSKGPTCIQVYSLVEFDETVCTIRN